MDPLLTISFMKNNHGLCIYLMYIKIIVYETWVNAPRWGTKKMPKIFLVPNRPFGTRQIGNTPYLVCAKYESTYLKVQKLHFGNYILLNPHFELHISPFRLRTPNRDIVLASISVRSSPK